ncbi:MAG: MATE family efflux transporter [Gemmatimonadetes bacterium]|nr:MATE family efflux transporter [Gemmatimonadota bacterium]
MTRSALPHRPGGVREVLALSWPAVINMLSITLMGAADTYFAGRLGTTEQAAVGFSSTLLWTALCFFVGTLELVQTFVAQNVGAAQPARAARWGSVGLQMALLFAVLLVPLAWLGRPLFEACGIAPELIPASDEYYRIRVLGAGIFLVTRVQDAYYRGVGDTRTPMVVAIIGNLLNVLLDAIFVLGWAPLGIPSLGVAGVAWATVIATVLQVGIYQSLWRRDRRGGRHTPRYLEKSPVASFRELFRVGAPAGLHWLLDLGAWTAFTVAVARLDPVQSAANIIGITVIRASFMPGYGVSTAAQTLVGQYLGAKDTDSAARAGWTSTGVAAVYMIAMGVAFWFFRFRIVGWFSDDPAVVSLGARLLIWAAFFQLGDAIQVVLAGALRGAGDTKFVMIASLTGAWFVFAPLAFILMGYYGMGAEAGWIAINAWVIVLSAMLIHRFRGSRWHARALDLEPR